VYGPACGARLACHGDAPINHNRLNGREEDSQSLFFAHGREFITLTGPNEE